MTRPVTQSVPACADPLGARVRRAALWSAGGNLLLRLGNVAMTAVIARILMPADFGVFAVALVVYSVVSCVGELGVTGALMRGDTDPDEIGPTVATVSLLSSLAMGAAMVLFADPLAAALGSPEAAGAIRVLALTVALVGFFAAPTALLVREFRQGRQLAANLLGFLPANALLVGLALGGGGALAFAWSRVLGQFVTGLLIVRWAPRRYLPGFDRAAARSVLRFGLPLAAANVVNYTLLNADYAVIGRALGPVELGIYLFAFNIAAWSSSLLASVVNSVALPAFSRVHTDAVRLQETLTQSARALATVAAPVALLTFGLAGPVVGTLGGPTWAEAAAPLGPLTWYGGVAALCLLFANVLAGLGRTRLLLGVHLVWLATLVPALAVAVDRWGIRGAAWAHVVVILGAILPLYLGVLRRVAAVDVRALLRALAAPVGAAAVAALAARAAAEPVGPAPLALVAGGACGGAVYALLVGPAVLAALPAESRLAARLRRVGRLRRGTVARPLQATADERGAP